MPSDFMYTGYLRIYKSVIPNDMPGSHVRLFNPEKFGDGYGKNGFFLTVMVL